MSDYLIDQVGENFVKLRVERAKGTYAESPH